jgi:hypothetical protein
VPALESRDDPRGAVQGGRAHDNDNDMRSFP